MATAPPWIAGPAEATTGKQPSRSQGVAKPRLSPRPLQPPIVQRASPDLHGPQRPAVRPGRPVIQCALTTGPTSYSASARAPLTLPQGVTLKMGGKLAGLSFDQPDALVDSGQLEKYLRSVADFKELADQYEVWLTAQSLMQRLPLKFTDPVKGRRLYYVAHGSARSPMFDDKDAPTIAKTLIDELRLDQGVIDDKVQYTPMVKSKAKLPRGRNKRSKRHRSSSSSTGLPPSSSYGRVTPRISVNCAVRSSLSSRSTKRTLCWL